MKDIEKGWLLETQENSTKEFVIVRLVKKITKIFENIEMKILK
jgi:hypothetical protein